MANSALRLQLIALCKTHQGAHPICRSNAFDYCEAGHRFRFEIITENATSSVRFRATASANSPGGASIYAA